MIVYGVFLLASGGAGPQAGVSNLWTHGGFFAHGLRGLVMSMAIIMFSFGGLEVIGITAAEAADPSRSIPRATNQTLWRILVFYVGALAVLLSLYPWDQIVPGASPFVLIFKALDAGIVAHVLNVVVLTAALSVYNSCVYCNSRMLFGLAEQGDAPRAFAKVDDRGVPLLAIGVSAFITLACVVVNYVIPHQALELLMSLVVAALVINWAMISLAHLMFRRAKNREGVRTSFRALWYPFGNWLCLAFVVFILGIMLQIPGIDVSVYAIPVWVVLMGICYLLKRKGEARATA